MGVGGVSCFVGCLFLAIFLCLVLFFSCFFVIFLFCVTLGQLVVLESVFAQMWLPFPLEDEKPTLFFLCFL